MSTEGDLKKSSYAPIILVPGFWLGAWAWDEVASNLRGKGHDVTALTLPGLESVEVDRSNISLSDHVDAICEAVYSAQTRVVLAVHSGAAISGYAASDRMPEQIAAMVYVDTFPTKVAMNPNFDSVEFPLPAWEELDESDILGMSDEHRALLRERAVPEPGAALREAPVLTNDKRLDVPSVMICTSHPSDEFKGCIQEGYEWIRGLAELRNLTYVDLPTHHWPMWSRPRELADIIDDVARSHAR